MSDQKIAAVTERLVMDADGESWWEYSNGHEPLLSMASYTIISTVIFSTSSVNGVNGLDYMIARMRKSTAPIDWVRPRNRMGKK